MASTFEIVVDGKAVATLRRGESANLEVPAGHHTVSARVGRAGSDVIDLDLADRDQAHVSCKSALRWFHLWPWALFYAIYVRRRVVDLRLLRIESPDSASGDIP